MLNSEQLELLQKYINNELSEQETALFNQYLTNNAEFVKEIALEQLINKSLRHPVIRARRVFDLLREELLVESTSPSTYTLDELLAMFTPHIELEEVVTRSSLADDLHKTLQSIVILPENGVNCSNTLGFDLDEAITASLQCQIYNNKRQEVVAQLIADNQVSFDVAFSLPPGRYYWELTPDRTVRQRLGTATGMFFVHEDLIR